MHIQKLTPHLFVFLRQVPNENSSEEKYVHVGVFNKVRNFAFHFNPYFTWAETTIPLIY